jgi:GH25 family lysozyme M1 (1,4-beta-N-acetylmuramidase)
MRDVVVCLKAAPHITDAQTLAFRKELEERQDVRVFHYSGVDELRAQLTAVCNGWARSVIDSPAAAAGAGA